MQESKDVSTLEYAYFPNASFEILYASLAVMAINCTYKTTTMHTYNIFRVSLNRPI
jgi:hypothetical protein